MFGLDLPDISFDSDADRTRRLERKLDLILEHLGIAPAPPPWQAEVEALVREGKNIEAIRAPRKATGQSLREAKSWIDELARGGRLPYMV